ncbi:hypothetical protein BCY88_08790 [Paraburkholderia fungorum]|uniref:Cytochrome b561 bacterial/Ni-hydrogenase domain-containing protein n=1 Tax=Paraburkholderia fungorum TaxID=134537 RepID=A0A420FRV8_9BURK|nr:hypothetical protein BCY88_08790 [Paraburkholderia fungorum]
MPSLFVTGRRQRHWDVPDAFNDTVATIDPQSRHPLWLRITHWLNALAAIVIVLPDWRIHDASPVFKGFMIPLHLTLDGWFAGALHWHFAAL